MKICIDAGHNPTGADTGAVGNGLKEQDITFATAIALRDKLAAMGHTVTMTRKTKDDVLGSDVASSLRERVRISDDWGSEFFVSIHCNSGVKAAMGTETLISGRGGLAEAYGARVQKAVTEKLGTVDRGVRVDTEYLGKRLYVLHNTDCPAILVETAFISNPSDAALLAQNADGFAAAIAEAFAEESGKYADIEGHWARAHIEKLDAYGVVGGFPDGTFRPDATLTRAECAAMVANALTVLGK